MAVEVDFFQIVFKEEQRGECYPFAKVYFNEKLTPFFENSVIQKLVMESKADKISVCSWKLKKKRPWNVCMPRELTEEVLKSDYQVLSFTCNTKYHQFLPAADKWHKGFISTMKSILESIGKPMPSFVKNPIYQNHFAANSEVYKRYVTEYLTPAMLAMDEEPLKGLCWKDSGYSQLNKGGASPEYLNEVIGVPYYPMHAFLLERLFAIYCQNERIKVTYL